MPLIRGSVCEILIVLLTLFVVILFVLYLNRPSDFIHGYL